VVAHYRPPVLATGTHFCYLVSYKRLRSEAFLRRRFFLSAESHATIDGLIDFASTQLSPNSSIFNLQASPGNMRVGVHPSRQTNRGAYCSPIFPHKVPASKPDGWRKGYAKIVIRPIIEVHLIAGFDANSDRPGERFNATARINSNVRAGVAESIK
jgi:hypothetical protein